LNGTTYSKLIAGLKAKNISLDRKILAELAVNEPGAFTEIVKTVSK
jgi:large subunit ribosomal protein L20